MYILIIYLMFGTATSIHDVEVVKWTLGPFTTLEECNAFPSDVDGEIFNALSASKPKGILSMCKREKDHEHL